MFSTILVQMRFFLHFENIVNNICSSSWKQNMGSDPSRLRRLHQNDRSMIQWICGIKPHDEISIYYTPKHLFGGYTGISLLVCQSVRWMGGRLVCLQNLVNSTTAVVSTWITWYFAKMLITSSRWKKVIHFFPLLKTCKNRYTSFSHSTDVM